MDYKENNLSLEINKVVYLGLMASFLFVLIVDRHFAMPFIIAEFFAFSNLFEPGSTFSGFIPFILIVTGQIFFMLFGVRKTSKIKLILLLISPILITIGLLLFSMELNEYHKLPTIKTMIPFWVVSIIFYGHSAWKIKNYYQQHL